MPQRDGDHQFYWLVHWYAKYNGIFSIVHSFFMHVCVASRAADFIASHFFCFLPLAIDVIIDIAGRRFGSTAISTNLVAVYNMLYNAVQITCCCTFVRSFLFIIFFFRWKSSDVGEMKLSQKNPQRYKLHPWGVITGENKIACYWLLFISWWGVHTTYDTYLISTPVSFGFSLLSSATQFRKKINKYRKSKRKMSSRRLGLSFRLFVLSSWRNFASWYFPFLQYFGSTCSSSPSLLLSCFIRFDQPPWPRTK